MNKQTMNTKQNMNDLRYIENEEKFFNHSFDVLKKYFSDNRKSFNLFYKSIGSEEKKNKFLKIASFYKFLVVDGKFIVESNKPDTYTYYLDHTYKYIAIFSFIEDLYADEEYKDFYSWLKSHKANIKFPIKAGELDSLYKRYLSIHGSTQKALRFFESLDDKTKNYITSNFQVTGSGKENFTKENFTYLARFFYQIRNDFIHKSKIIAQFNNGTTIHSIGNKRIKNNLGFEDVKMIFEKGFLKFFWFCFYRNASCSRYRYCCKIIEVEKSKSGAPVSLARNLAVAGKRGRAKIPSPQPPPSAAPERSGQEFRSKWVRAKFRIRDNFYPDTTPFKFLENFYAIL